MTLLERAEKLRARLAKTESYDEGTLLIHAALIEVTTEERQGCKQDVTLALDARETK